MGTAFMDLFSWIFQFSTLAGLARFFSTKFLLIFQRLFSIRARPFQQRNINILKSSEAQEWKQASQKVY
jgi:hypothetical protein